MQIELKYVLEIIDDKIKIFKNILGKTEKYEDILIISFVISNFQDVRTKILEKSVFSIEKDNKI